MKVEVCSGLGHCLDGPFDTSQHPDCEDRLQDLLGLVYALGHYCSGALAPHNALALQEAQ